VRKVLDESESLIQKEHTRMHKWICSFYLEGVGRSWKFHFGHIQTHIQTWTSGLTEQEAMDNFEQHRRQHLQDECYNDALKLFYFVENRDGDFIGDLGNWMTDAQNLTQAEYRNVFINVTLVHEHRQSRDRNIIKANMDPRVLQQCKKEQEKWNSLREHILQIRQPV